MKESHSSSSSINWTRDKIFQLIFLYKSEPCLWDCNTEQYKCREIRDSAIAKICDQLSINREQFSKKIHNLRNQFNYEAKKVFKRNVDSKESYQSKWEFYNSLKFLKNVIAPRPGFSSQGLDDIPNSTMNHNISIADIVSIVPQKKYSNTERKTRSNAVTQVEEMNITTEDQSSNHDEQIEKIFGEINPKIENERLITINMNDPEFIEEPIISNKKMRISTNNNESSSTGQTSSSGRNEYDVFGEFISSELKNLRSDVSRKKLKRKIMHAILEVSADDDGD